MGGMEDGRWSSISIKVTELQKSSVSGKHVVMLSSRTGSLLPHAIWILSKTSTVHSTVKFSYL